MKLVRASVLVTCLLLGVCFLALAASVKSDCKVPRLLLVSYDGFSSDYFSRGITPRSAEFQREGVYVKRLHSVFPTKTFTNHFTIATGLYPEVHGVTANELYDRKYGHISYSAQMFQHNKDVIPIWTLNEMANKTSGCMMWPGSDFLYQNITCTHNYTFDKKLPLKERVDIVIKWFTDEKKPANLVVLYIEQPDSSGHRDGTTSSQTNGNIKEVDEITGYIQEQLKIHELLECTNIIHLSDHGMIEVNTSSIIDFSPFLVNGSYTTYGTSPVLQIVPANESSTDDIYNRLLNASKTLGHFHVYKQPDLPEKWHVKLDRFGPIVAVADINFVFQDLYKSIAYYRNKYNITGVGLYGQHGYDNKYPQMAGFLMGKGPSFPKGKVIEDYQNIDLFNLFVKILDLPNAPKTNGSYERAITLLQEESSNTVSIIVAVVLLLVVVACLLVFMEYRRKRDYCMWI